MPAAPAGYKRSRALWEEARRPGAPRAALLRAILYELQPIRFSSLDTDAAVAWWASFRQGATALATETLPRVAHGTYRMMRGMSRRHWMIVGAVVAYYYGVRYIHQILDAGPLVLIITALVLIFTVGLGDNQNQDGLSAYSVFNRGFQRLLGSVDADALLQQHVGGALGFAGAAVPPPAPQQQQQHEDLDAQADRQHPPAAARRPPREPIERPPENAAHGVHEEMQDANNDNVNRGQARRSGKKARRRNLEQRREVQRQRQAALEMGFAGNGSPEEMMAMQRLIEEQINANNQE